jgi:hypothetical protein
MYMPTVTDARRVESYVIGPYIGVVLTDCRSVGAIEYKHLLIVYLPDPMADDSPQVVMAVAAELAAGLREMQDGDQPLSYFLGVFPGSGHLNLGASPDWGELSTFTGRALEVVREHLKVDRLPVRIPDDAGRKPHTDD